jgi:hypothetical protein
MENLAIFTEAFRRVQRGIKLLDRKVPRWRQLLRRHEDEFDFTNGEFCVLGTLEHYSKRMKQLRTLSARRNFDGSFNRAYGRLGIKEPAADYGFDMGQSSSGEISYPVLDALWRAEFEKR